MRWNGDTAIGVLVVLTSVGLIVTGIVDKGRGVRPFAAKRARAAAARAYTRDLQRAADTAIATARHAAGEGEPAIVTVDAVVRLTRERYGHDEVDPIHAAATLRRRFTHGGCATDCVTDAFV
ncbi:hypothetical protein [Streptomyces sp. NPDC056144]|uniref:hypothetical protein n=1 Tax=unclassified Streptomyces TaxID=2593676 RepID=UPI0035DA7B6D